MSEPINVGIVHPVSLTLQSVDAMSYRPEPDVALHARDGKGNRITIIASRERWAQLLSPGLVQPSEADIAKAMYVRGEVEVEAFEQVLELGK